MKTDFEDYKDCYVEEIQRALPFKSISVDLFVEVKAEYILSIARKFFSDLKALKVLDVGCGIGLTDQHLQDRFGSLCGVDVSQGIIEKASSRNSFANYQAYDGLILPYGSEFDCVFAICVLHHILPANWSHFINEMYRVTKKGGITIIFEHNPLNPLTLRAVNRCAFDKDATLLRRRQVMLLFERAGLCLIEKRYILYFPSMNPIVKRVESGLQWLPFGAQYYVVAKK